MIEPKRDDVGKIVTYVPNHAQGDLTHPDCQVGHITSFNESCVFVRFHRYSASHSTSHSVKREQLVWG